MSMTNNTQDAKLLPPGPEVPIDLDATKESFGQISDLLDKYGDIVRLRSAKRKSDSYLINHPDYIKHVLSRNHTNYNKGLAFNRVKMLLGNGIIVSDGDFWRKQRQMMQSAFSKKVIGKLSETMVQCNLNMLDKWQQIAEHDGVINITDMSSTLALDIVLRSLFSDDVDAMIAKTGGNPFAFLTEDTTRDMQLVLKYRGFAKLLLEIVQKRRAEKKTHYDFVSMFMAARDKDTGEPMTDQELLDEIMTLIVAGHETSAITLNWVWYFLSQHPEIEQRVFDEIMAKVQGDVPRFDEVMQLSYVRQVTEEALRYYPPVWLYTRKSIDEDMLGDYYVPPGTDIYLAPYFLHRNTEFWDVPAEFNPDRFSKVQIKDRHTFAYIPFSGGPRRCIGDFFGIVEIQVHMAIMMKKFRLVYQPDHPLELEPGVNLRTRYPINMQIIRR